MRKTLTLMICLLITIFLSGCAKNPNASNIDPYEKINRFTFAFNQDLDHLIFRPVAKTYDTLVPPPLKKGITNFFNNIQEITTFPNDILQGKIRWAFVDFWRLVINSTIGIGGLFDVATKMGLPKHYEDFGMTLAVWDGGHKSPYLVLPVLGPSTFRAGFGKIFDVGASPYPYIQPRAIGWTAEAVRLLNERAKLLSANKLVDTAFDPYVFVRDAYLQRRNKLIRKNMKPYKTKLQRDIENGRKPQYPYGVPVTREELRPLPNKNNNNNHVPHHPMRTRNPS